MKHFLYALFALIVTLSFSMGVTSAAWVAGDFFTSAVRFTLTAFYG
jgi:hypothetical protein